MISFLQGSTRCREHQTRVGIHIHFYLTREELLKELQPREVEITEANTWYLTST